MTPALSKEEESVVSVIISFSVLLLLVGVIIAAPHCMQIAFATKKRLADRRWSYANVIQSFYLCNKGDEATTDLLLTVGAELLDVSTDKMLEMITEGF